MTGDYGVALPPTHLNHHRIPTFWHQSEFARPFHDVTSRYVLRPVAESYRLLSEEHRAKRDSRMRRILGPALELRVTSRLGVEEDRHGVGRHGAGSS